MNNEIRGSRPRPRVALVGSFGSNAHTELKKLFPTYYEFDDFHDMENGVDESELDLIVIGDYKTGMHVPLASNYFNSVHVICFSPAIQTLPGPRKKQLLYIETETETEEYTLPQTNLSFSRQRELDLQYLSNTKGWYKISMLLQSEGPHGISFTELKDIKQPDLENYFGNYIGSIISESKTLYPLAVIFNRIENGLGIAWLPNEQFNVAAWTKIIATEWSKTDSERFPNLGNWASTPDWMTSEEVDLFEKIQSLESEKIRVVQKFKNDIGKLNLQLTDLSLETNLGKRRLITAQSDDLVSAVENAFIELGFEVKNMDNELDDNMPKREDLRLSLQNNENNWEAIVEVRGYSKSAGKTSDFQRLDRFAKLYLEENGQFPNKQIYVVNGEIDLLPPQRQEILASAEEDITVFAENDGLIISTIDLYKVVKDIDRYDLDEIRQSIIVSLGRWKPPI